MERSDDALATRETSMKKFILLKTILLSRKEYLTLKKNKLSTFATLAKRPESALSNLSLQSREKRAKKEKKGEDSKKRFRSLSKNSYL
jgi:hypothetical protein